MSNTSPTTGQSKSKAKPSSPKTDKAASALMEMESGRSEDMDAIALLKQDHRDVETLLEKFEEAEESGEKQEIAQTICLALTIHAEIEEAVFYPAARKALDDEDLLNEAEVEHTTVKELIAKIEGMRSNAKLFEATVTVLGEYVKHHVKEEENELFPKCEESDMDLEAIGEKLLKKKQSTMERYAG